MESWSEFCSKSLIDKIVFHLIGVTRNSTSLIKVNNENLAVNGELHFQDSLNAWKSHVVCDENCRSILQHLAHARADRCDNADADAEKEVFNELISKSKDWSVGIERCVLRKERVSLFLTRVDVLRNVIRTAIECGTTFGKTVACEKGFDLKYHSDAQSDLTTQRLRLIRNFAAKILNLHGYRVSDDCVDKYMFITKSETSINGGYEKYICGVVKNLQSNAKETRLTWEQYIKRKVDHLTDLNEHKLFEGDSARRDLFLRDLASAIVIFELMTAKPSRSVIIGNSFENDRSVANTKGASFILYNTARIAMIKAKYNEKASYGDYPSLPSIEDTDFSRLLEEEEWELVYNFIFMYPQMLRDCLKLEPNFQIYPQKICVFLLRLCQKFSVYYRKIRILTEGGNHLFPKMFARMHMLSALQIVLDNALDTLDIKAVSRM